MTQSFKQAVAMLMLLWLPFAHSSAVAASLLMRLQQEDCNGMSSMQVMAGEEGASHHAHHAPPPTGSNENDAACDDCGVCHLACADYLAVPAIGNFIPQLAGPGSTPYLVHLHSHISAPLVPPPIVCA